MVYTNEVSTLTPFIHHPKKDLKIWNVHQIFCDDLMEDKMYSISKSCPLFPSPPTNSFTIVIASKDPSDL